MQIRFLTADEPEWEEAFFRLPKDRRDVFYGPDYARLCQQTTCCDHRVLCALADTAEGPLLYPFVIRALSKVAGLTLPGLFDMVGLYGRNGVVCDSAMPADRIIAFHRCLASFANEHGVVCSFDRFHPVLQNQWQAASDARIVDVGRFTVLDLTDDIEAIERNYRHSLRKDVKKAERSGVSTFTEIGVEHLDDFLSVYHHTMDRRSAQPSYWFDAEYFLKLAELLAGQFLFIYAMHNDHIASCELALFHEDYSHSFLGGTLRSALPYGCNQLLKRDLIRELKRLGCHYFLLGGGLSVGDGIEKYKSTFAPIGQRPSYVGGRVFNKNALEEVRRAMLHAGKSINASRIQFYDVEK
jgi:Acetyltransferase (GNAT) domain